MRAHTWLFVVTLLVSASSPHAHAAPAPDTLVARHAPSYDLYAPTAAQLDTSAREIDHAVDVFTACFGEAPPKIAVVVMDSPDVLRGLDLARYRPSSGLVLPWVTSSYLANRERNLSANRELGAVLSWSTDGGLGVVTPLPPTPGDTTRAAGVDLAAGDVIRALDGAPVRSLKDLEDRWDALPAGREVALEIRRGDATPTLRVRKRAAAASASKPATASAAASARALSHEAGHLLLKAWVDARLGRRDTMRAEKTASPHYGSDVLPDWLDEAFATLCEFPELQSRRRALMLAKADARIPLAELFTMAHPVAMSQQDLLARARQQMAPGQTSGMFIMRGDNALVSDKALVFYAECLSVAQFMIDREGAGFIGRLTAELAAGRDVSAALAVASKLPHDVPALETAWVASLHAPEKAPAAR